MNWFQELTDILKCKVLLLTGRLKYPLSILPKKHYVRQININKLYEEIPLIVVRRSEKTQEKLFNKFGILREDAFSETDIPNMSINLLGGKFKSDYIRFNPTKEATKTWDGQEQIFYSKYHPLVQILSEVIPIFFDVINLHNLTFPYQRNKDKDVNKLIEKLALKPVEIEGKYQFQGKSVISHEPTQLNYWHVEFQIKDIEDNLISNTKSAWKKNAAEMALKNVICVSASMTCNKVVDIPLSYFTRNS
jgi:hypothetical protein